MTMPRLSLLAASLSASAAEAATATSFSSAAVSSADRPIVAAFLLPGAPSPSLGRSRHSTATAIGAEPFVDRVRIDEDAPRDVSAMEEWAAACGVQRSEGFQLTGEYLDEGGGHLDVSAMTTSDVAAGETVLYVPSEAILSSDRAMEEFGGSLGEAEDLVIRNGASDFVRHYYLMIKVLCEWERGDESPWYAYLNSLPRYFSNAASMTPFCYKCVPPLVASLSKKERATLNHLSVKRVPFLTDETKGNADLWRWAFQVVFTRSFEANDGSGDLRVVPLADMFNHGTETEIELAYDELGNCYATAMRDVPAGSPLRMSYGDPTNPSFLFARYGFLDETSPATFCKWTPSHVTDELRDMGYAHDRMLFYRETGDVSEEVWDVLLYHVLGESGAPELQGELHRAHMSDDYETKQSLHEQYYPQTSAKLLEHIDTFLDRLDELSGKTLGRDVADHPRLPLILRHNEFVRETFSAVRSRHFE